MSAVLNAASGLTGTTVSMNDLVQAIVKVGQGKWLDIAVELDVKFQEALNLETDYPNWDSKKRLQKVLSDYQLNKGDNESSRQHLIDVCDKVKIGGALRDVLNFRER